MKASRHSGADRTAGEQSGGHRSTPGKATLTQNLPAAGEQGVVRPRGSAWARGGEDGGGGAPAGDGVANEGAHEELESSGQQLEGAVRAKVEQRFGTNLSHVRVHTDTRAGAMVVQRGARAFTYKNHIAFAPGAYDPSSPEGEALIAHELTHVLQTGATSARAKVPGASDAGGPHEVEADRNAQRAHKAATAPAGKDAAPAGNGGEHGKDAPLYESSQHADPERRHQCGGGGGTPTPPPTMTMSPVTISVKQAAIALSQRGSAEYKVQWSVGGGKNGWVIQHVKFQGAIQNAGGPVAAQNSGLEYWEGWQVRNGDVFIGSSASAHQSDTFRTVSEDVKTKGQVEIIGKVAFIEGYNLTEPSWGHSVAAAGALPTMTTAPAGWTDGSAQNHTLRVNYDDIAGTPQTQVGTP